MDALVALTDLKRRLEEECEDGYGAYLCLGHDGVVRFAASWIDGERELEVADSADELVSRLAGFEQARRAYEQRVSDVAGRWPHDVSAVDAGVAAGQVWQRFDDARSVTVLDVVMFGLRERDIVKYLLDGCGDEPFSATPFEFLLDHDPTA